MLRRIALRTVTLTRWHAAVVVTGAALVVSFATNTRAVVAAGDLGIDFEFYREVGHRYLTSGTYYLPHQLSGSYEVTLLADVLYPPSTLLLFVPLAVMPGFLWWAIPIGVTSYCVGRWRPSTAGVAIMLALLAWPRANAAFLFGNTDIWVMAGVAAGLRWGWPAALLVLKPVFAPFALIGIRRPTWWLALLATFVLTLGSAELWGQYLTAVINLRASPISYSLPSFVLAVIPLAAWWTRARHAGELLSSGRIVCRH